MWSVPWPSAPLLFNDKVVRCVYEDVPRYGKVKPDLPQHCYGAYDPSPVVSSRTCLASSTSEAGTRTSLGPADRKSGASKPGARWISEGMPASFSTLSISSPIDSSGAAATFTHLSTMHLSYPRLFTEACRRVLPGSGRRSCRRYRRLGRADGGRAVSAVVGLFAER
jgi:hypothetical protein